MLADETNEKSKQTIRAKMEQYISRVETLKGANAAPAPKKAAAAGDKAQHGGKEEDDENKTSEAALKSFSQALLPAGTINKVEIHADLAEPPPVATLTCLLALCGCARVDTLDLLWPYLAKP